jgi:hypothetical protein
MIYSYYLNLDDSTHSGGGGHGENNTSNQKIQKRLTRKKRTYLRKSKKRMGEKNKI